MTPLDFHKIKEYSGIDITPCFSKLHTLKAYIYTKKVHFHTHHLYLTERGSQPSSLDTYLYLLAKKEGVTFEFSQPLTPKILSSIPNKSIIATGTYSRLSNPLHLPHTPFIHLNSHKNTKHSQNFCIAYFKSYIAGYGYAYIAGIKNLTSVEIDLRKTPSYKKHLQQFKKQLKQTENLTFTKWTMVDDHIPNKPQLLQKLKQKTYILAGSISGFHDPFFGFGVNSALISGTIAARTIHSKRIGLQAYNQFFSTLNRMFLLSKIYHHLPLKKLIIPKIFQPTTTSIPIIKKNLQSIPGFTHDECFKIKKID
jgi:hypothetical protein